MPRGVYDRSKSKKEGTQATKAKNQAKAPAKTQAKAGPAKQYTATKTASGSPEQFTALVQGIATLSSLNPATFKTAAPKIETELTALIEALSTARQSLFGRSSEEQARHDAEQEKAKADREAARAAKAQESEQESPVAQNGGTIPASTRPIVPVPPAPATA